MNECPDTIQIEALVDGEDVEHRDALAAHVAGCEACTQIARDTEALNRLVREAMVQGQPPLPATVSSLSTGLSPSRFSRRAVLAGGGMLAASIAGLALVLRRDTDPVLIENLTTTYFGDFDTLMAAERRLDINESDPAQVLAWFGDRVSFALPRIDRYDGLSLRGGRLCWLLDRRNAALHFDTQDGACCLYLASGGGLATAAGVNEPILMQRGGVSGVFWQSGDVIHALIGEPSGPFLADLARSFISTT